MGKSLAVTSLGLLTPLGEERGAVWERLARGERCYGLDGLEGRGPWGWGPAGRIPDDRLDELLPARKYRRLPRYSKLVLAAAAACVAGLGGERSLAEAGPGRVGVFLGTGRGPLEAVESLSEDLVAEPARQVNATQFPETVYNAPLGHLSIHYGLTGPCIAVSAGSASGLMALEMAASSLDAGRIDLALVGGVDTLTEGYQRGLRDARVLAGRRGRRRDMAPFAADRNGIVASEGAVFVALESAAPGAPVRRRPLARLLTAAVASDGFSFYANEPAGAGFAYALGACCRQTGLAPGAIELILAAASGEKQLDRAEWEGLRRSFSGAPAPLVTALKGLTGDMGAAGGLLALAVCCEIFARGTVPGLAQGGEIDPDCDLRLLRATTAVQVGTALINEASWGGLNAAVLLSRAEEAP